MLVKSYMVTYRFPANITNCSNNYGPYQFPEKLIPLIINNALQGKKLPDTMYADGIKRTIQWFFENEEWMKNVTSGDIKNIMKKCINKQTGSIFRGYCWFAFARMEEKK